MSDTEALRIYAENQAAIDKIWTANEGYTMRDAVLHWQRGQKSYSEIYSEMASLYLFYRNMGNSRKEARAKATADLQGRYKRDGKILKLLLTLLPYLLFLL